MYDVTGKVVFVTGGAAGLGKAFSHALLQRGAKVFLADSDVSTGAATQEELSAQFGAGNVIFRQCDVTDSSTFEEAFQAAVALFGHVDVMVNSAGILNEAVWERMIDINYTGTVRGTKIAMEHMRKDKGGKGGRIINQSSIVGLYDEYALPAYTGTKHAVRSFTSALALEPDLEANTGVSLASLCADATATDLILQLDHSRMKDFTKMTPVIEKRILEVDTVTQAFLKLLQLDSMNGAQLLVQREGSSFQKMVMESLGQEFPPQESQ